jgi:hypothetical protein
MKNPMTHPLTIVAFVWGLSLPLAGQEVPDNPKVDPRIEFFPLRITARIVDERGQPIEGSNVDIARRTHRVVGWHRRH